MAYAKGKSPQTLSKKQIQYIQEMVPNVPAAERPAAEDADIIFETMEKDLLYRGFDDWYNLTEYGQLAESIMYFIEDNYPELFQ